MEAVFTVLSIQDQIVPPTLNLENQDPSCQIQICSEAAQKRAIRYAMKNNFGFGGTNASVIFKAPD